MNHRYALASLLLVGLAACGGAVAKAPPATSMAKPARATTSASGQNGAADATSKTGPGVLTQGLHVSQAIAELCALPEQKGAPHFDFDSSQLSPQDRDVLAAVARCMTDGALRGKSLALVGRADARGETEYNMGLGEARADSVRRYLHDLGISSERVTSSSRGELDAMGADEEGWALDRRVDIELASM